jgi:hypothetical protein
MPDDNEIKSILLDMGLYSLAMAYVGSERELFRLFADDFEKLASLCQK